MTQRTAADSPTSWLRAAALWAVPWLCSTTLHLLLLLALALSYSLVVERGMQQGDSLLSSIEAAFVASPSADDLGQADTVSLDSAQNRYYEDEPQPAERETPQAQQGGGAGDRSALADLLNEKPAVELAGVLPSSGAGLGLGSGQGEGVGSAQGLTAQPLGSNQMRGGAARTGVFGAIAEGHKFVYVFDRSGSMDGHGGAPLAAAKSELLSSLEHLGQTHQFQIIFYNEKPRVFNPSGVAGRLVFGNSQNKYLAQKFVGSITADGATRHEEALEMALRLSPDVIFFLTDADEPRLSSEQLAQIARANRGTIINAIEFGYGPQTDPSNFLVRLAQQSGGKHVYVDVSQLPRARGAAGGRAP